jgi:hypothetical protein
VEVERSKHIERKKSGRKNGPTMSMLVRVIEVNGAREYDSLEQMVSKGYQPP